MFPWQREKPPNRWRGLVLGVIGSLFGLILMRLYRQQVAPLVRQDSQAKSGSQDERADALESISVAGKHHQQGESATAALGRILYDWAADEKPDKEIKSVLSQLVHWGYGMAQGGVYGLLRPRVDWPDLRAGLLFGAGLWLFGDEIVVPMLGLQKGPTASSLRQHLNRLGMHLSFGAGTALATQTLNSVFREE